MLFVKVRCFFTKLSLDCLILSNVYVSECNLVVICCWVIKIMETCLSEDLSNLSILWTNYLPIKSFNARVLNCSSASLLPKCQSSIINATIRCN